MKRISIEVGRNAPFIIFDDVDIDKAIEGSILISRGARTLFVHATPIQVLSYANSADWDRPVSVRTASMYLQSSIYANLTSRLTEKVAAFKVENRLDEMMCVPHSCQH